jgi:hypothetical protein
MSSYVLNAHGLFFEVLHPNNILKFKLGLLKDINVNNNQRKIFVTSV